MPRIRRFELHAGRRGPRGELGATAKTIPRLLERRPREATRDIVRLMPFGDIELARLGTGSERKMMALTSVKTADAPPMPSASETMAMSAKPGARRRTRAPYCTSRTKSISQPVMASAGLQPTFPIRPPLSSSSTAGWVSALTAIGHRVFGSGLPALFGVQQVGRIRPGGHPGRNERGRRDDRQHQRCRGSQHERAWSSPSSRSSKERRSCSSSGRFSWMYCRKIFVRI